MRTTGAEEVVWDLSDIYAGPADPRLDADVEEALAAAARFRQRYRGNVARLEADALAAAVAELERLHEIVHRAQAFAYMLFAADTADPARGALLQRLEERGTALATEVLFFDLEWIAVEDDHGAELLSDPAVARYRHHLQRARRYRPYVLTEPEEKVLAEKAMTSSAAWSRLFTELTSALRIPIDGEDLSLEEALSRLYGTEREARRRAAEGITGALDGELRLRSFVFNTLLLDKATEDRLRGYPHWLSARNLANEASDEAVQTLVDAVVARYDIPRRYYRLKAGLLGIPRLADYDRLAPVGSDAGVVPWDDARDTVLGAYEDFSPVAGKIVRDFFDRRWIDAALRAGKQPGAFCMTTVPGVHPYVMMSYTGERRSVLTLAHELGHGLHGALAGDLGLFNAETPLTLSETASVFGEALTFRRLLERESDPGLRLSLLTSRLEDAIATVFRQVAMNRFEEAVHTARRKDGELTTETLGELWTASQRDMLGDEVELTDGYRRWWSYVHHFVAAPGYVYAYAFGFLFSLAIYRRWEEVGDAVVEPYLDLLRAGGSDLPETLARIVGLDLADPGFWGAGLEALDGLLVEAEQLAASRPLARG